MNKSNFLLCLLSLIILIPSSYANDTEKIFVNALAKRESADYNGSRKLLESIASKDPKAKYYLGTLALENKAGLRYGQGEVLQNEACKQLAKNHVSNLDYLVASYCYEDGKGVEKDATKAAEFRQIGYEALKSYASSGNLWALYLLAWNSKNGTFGTKDDSKALELYEKSCSLGGARACSELGLIYENNKDTNTANALYKKSCDIGYDNGCFNLGFNFLNGIGISPTSDVWKETMNHFQMSEYFQKKCEYGNTETCTIIKERIGLELYNKACELGYGYACYRHGLLHVNNTFNQYTIKGGTNSVIGSNSYIKAILNGYKINAQDSDYLLTFISNSGDENYKQMLANYYANSIINNDDTTLLTGTYNFIYHYSDFHLFKQVYENHKSEYASSLDEYFVESCVHGKIKYVNFFITEGVNINFINEYGSTPLSYTAESGNIEVGKILLKNGAKPHYSVDYNILPINIALIYDNIDFAKLLIDHGANVNVKSKDGTTVLMTAIKHTKDENLDFINLLLKKGVDVNAKTNDGRTALDYAIENEKFLVAKRLKEYSK